MYPLLFSLLFTLVPVQAATLKESFQAAMKNMESIKRAEQGIVQREEQRERAKGSLQPLINGFATYTRIDPPQAAGASPFLLTKQYSVGVRLTQPLIRGGLLSAMNLANDNILLAKFQKDATELNLYQLVISAYYNLKIAQVDVQNLQKLLSFSKERVAEIRKRANIGRSRRGELVEAEAQWHSSESQYQQGLINLGQVEENYKFLTKLEPGIIPELSHLPKVEEALETYREKVKNRPDIMATKQTVKAADDQITIAKGSHYPSVDLVGNYYIDRTGILATSEWDAGLQISVPFYQGGQVVAATREAVAAKRIAELTSDETLRIAERELSIIFQNYRQLQAQLDASKQAVAKSEEAYKLNKSDFTNGIVTNLDVLVSLNAYIQNKRTYDTLYAMAHMTYNNLEAATGVLP
jgi:outer membrane protein